MNKEHKKTRLIKWGIIAVCLVTACAAAVLLLTDERDKPIGGDLAPMIFINDTLYRASGTQTFFTELKEEFEYLGEITSSIDSSEIPEKEFQANDSITGAEVYRYGDDIVVRINGKYWIYELYGKESSPAGEDDFSEIQSDGAADYPLMFMVDGQLYHDSGEITEDLPSDEPDGEILSSCDGEPTENNQSNFGTGYGYRYGENNTVLIRFENGWQVFIPFAAEKDIDWDSLSEQEKMEMDPMYNAD